MSKLYVAMYHYTRPLKNSRYSNIRGLEEKLFRKQIEFMKNRFSVVTMEQVIGEIRGETHLPENSLLLTFDDGYIDNFLYAFPILEEYDIQGSFFIPGKTFTTHELLDVNKVHYILASANPNDLLTDVKEQVNYYCDENSNYPTLDELYSKYAVENRFDCKSVVFIKRMLQTVLPEEIRKEITRNLFKKYVGIPETTLANELYMTPEQIQTLKRHGMYIGIHGYDHYWLGNLSKTRMEDDIDKALDVMSSYVDLSNWVMNYPYGSYNDSVTEYVKKRGACMGITTRVGVANLESDNPLELPRLDCNDFPPKSERYKEWLVRNE